jgi:hypothetical protein
MTGPVRLAGLATLRLFQPLKTPFRHLTQFPLNNLLHLLRITTESMTANGSMSALGHRVGLRLLAACPFLPRRRPK